MNLTSLILAALLAAVSTRANISYQASFLGLNPPDGVTSFTATGGSVVSVVEDGVPFLGVSGGGSQIGAGQSLTVTFDGPVVMGAIELGLLFSDPKEVALLTVGEEVYTLRSLGAGKARYLHGDHLLSKPLGIDSTVEEYGMFTIQDPFEGQSLTSFTLSAAKGDFGLVSFNTRVEPRHVPDGSALLPLSLTLIALSLYRRC